MRLLCCLLPFLLISVAKASDCAGEVVLPPFERGSALILGEVHGTVEAPAYFLRVVCAIARHDPGAELVVGLEYPSGEQSHLDTFLVSGEVGQARAELLATPFWQRRMQDGRSSAAMLQLVESLWSLRRDGFRVRVVAFDDWQVDARDKAMAGILDAAVEARRDARLVVLTGNVHARKTPGFGANPEFRSMAAYLKVPTRSLAFRARRGTYWACRPDCGVVDATPNELASELPRFDLTAAEPSAHYDGIIELGVVSASLPAVSAVARQAQGTD